MRPNEAKVKNGEGMSGLLSLIFILVIIKTIDIIIKDKKKTGYKKLSRVKVKQEHAVNEKQVTYKVMPWDTPYPVNKGIVKWDKAFLKELEWKLFEDICMEYLRIKNCDANVTCIGADGGIDMKISDINGNVFALAQCKAWNKPIGVSLIRELFGVMASERVKHGIFLTTSVFSDDAKEFAKGKALILIDGEEFINIINGLKDEDRRRIDNLIYKGDHTTPTCVNCNTKLIKRTTKTGPNAGRMFWGCVNYPRCKVRMHIRSAH